MIKVMKIMKILTAKFKKIMLTFDIAVKKAVISNK